MQSGWATEPIVLLGLHILWNMPFGATAATAASTTTSATTTTRSGSARSWNGRSGQLRRQLRRLGRIGIIPRRCLLARIAHRRLLLWCEKGRRVISHHVAHRGRHGEAGEGLEASCCCRGRRNGCWSARAHTHPVAGWTTARLRLVEALVCAAWAAQEVGRTSAELAAHAVRRWTAGTGRWDTAPHEVRHILWMSGGADVLLWWHTMRWAHGESTETGSRAGSVFL